MICDTTFTARGDTDPRVAELQELAATEGFKIAVAIDLVLWFEDRGFVMDLHTGVAMKVSIAPKGPPVTPSGRAVNHLLSPVTDSEVDHLLDTLICTRQSQDCAPDGTLQMMVDGADRDVNFYEAELQELVDGRFDDEYHASGNW